ncbi:MAG: hypothetical protein JO317_03475 [Verrucomicrobiae bacterium]|nr:hypothetical protein [Verrucomicrobiae bacterium]
MDGSLPPNQLAAIQEAIFSGRKIEAIKLYRSASRLDLKDAKDAVDRMEAGLLISSPERFTVRPKSGCGTAVLVCGIAASALAMLRWLL